MSAYFTPPICYRPLGKLDTCFSISFLYVLEDSKIKAFELFGERAGEKKKYQVVMGENRENIGALFILSFRSEFCNSMSRNLT